MRIQPIAMLSLAAALTICLAFIATPSAEASPRFTIGNKTDKSLSVEIYNGDDSVCMQSSKTKQLAPQETDTYGCDGNGKGRCKIEIFKSGNRICNALKNTCNTAIKMKDESVLYIFKTEDGFECAFG